MLVKVGRGEREALGGRGAKRVIVEYILGHPVTVAVHQDIFPAVRVCLSWVLPMHT